MPEPAAAATAATATPAPPVLEIDRLAVSFAGVPAVREISFSVKRGEMVGLIGPNGAGKSTTLLSIMGAAPVVGGEVRVDGASLRGRRTEDIARSGVALVPEGRHIFPGLTVAENLELGEISRRDDGSHPDSEIDVRELFPIVEEFRHRQAGALSGGQQQQLAIARALLSRPHLLLLDEPSLGLAPSVVEVVWSALRQIRERGVTILLVEQRAQITVQLADRSYVMNNGELRAELAPSEAEDLEKITTAYFGATAEGER
ncbi:MAG: ABC transporter ATP-binding protein [Actinobacteria bacterium]|nr:ABC transporter ATP-binding protein [Actinomycetota bacterium]